MHTSQDPAGFSISILSGLCTAPRMTLTRSCERCPPGLSVPGKEEERSLLRCTRRRAALQQEIQPQLLRYRLQNFQAVQASRFDAPGFTAGMRGLARALAASVVGDPTLTAGVIPLLSAQDEEIRASSGTLPDFAIIVTLLAFPARKQEPRVPVKKLTEFVTHAVLNSNGEIREYNTVEVGNLLSRSEPAPPDPGLLVACWSN